MGNLLRKWLSWVLSKTSLGMLVGFSLLFVLISSVVWWLNHFTGQQTGSLLGSSTILALFLTWLLARTRLAGWSLAVLVLSVGLIVVVLGVGKLVNPIIALTRSIISLFGVVRFWRPGQPVADVTLTRLLARDLNIHLVDLAQRTGNWMVGLIRGSSIFDPQAAGLAWGVVLWCAAAWAAWGVRRRGQPLLAVLPLVAILAASLAFAREQLFYLVPSFGAALGLLAWSQYTHRSQDWLKQSVDYATDIPFDLMVWTGAIVVILAGVAMLAARPSPHQAFRLARNLLVTRSRSTETLGQSLGLEPAGDQAQQIGGVGVLPRQHLLGSGPELSQRVAYLVQVFEPTSDNKTSGNRISPLKGKLYWQGVSYDVYDGRGWSTSPTTDQDYSGGEAIPLLEESGSYYWIEQEVQAPGDASRQVLQTGELAEVDQPVMLDSRQSPPDQPDVFGARMSRSPGTRAYRAISRLLAPGQAELAAAGYDYPAWIADRYLQLPTELPVRVQELAAEITAGKTSPYDRAKAIEAYVRQIQYTLALPAPPEGRDLVDYYLFDLQRGYCDYSATAMAVLARSVRLPARLMVGYAPGHYDASTGLVVITEAEAHSWPEIYFSGVGWVRFEPTGGRAPSALPAPPHSVVASEPHIIAATPHRIEMHKLPWVTLAILVVTGLFVWAAIRERAARRGRTETLSLIYANLRRLGKRLDAPDWPGLTPAEVTAGIGVRVLRLAEAGRLEQILAPARSEMNYLVALYTQAIYSPWEPKLEEVDDARRIWRKLRWRLWLTIIQHRSNDFSRHYRNG
jgi:hypothetical protein